MSSRAHRVSRAPVQAFHWLGSVTHAPAGLPHQAAAERPAPERSPTAVAVMPGADLEAVEREAFARGYSEGERAGTLASLGRTEGLVQQLSKTLGELVSVRTDVARKTERQLVQLALAIARRVVGRELNADRELLVAMARVAIDRIGGSGSATIKLHPTDYAFVVRNGTEQQGPVRLEADPQVCPGGCQVHSEFGLMDASVGAQFEELSHALLGDSDAPVIDVTPATHGPGC